MWDLETIKAMNQKAREEQTNYPSEMRLSAPQKATHNATQIRVQWQGNGKMYYFSGLQSLIDNFTPGEISKSWISIIYRSEVVGSLDSDRIADMALAQRKAKGVLI